MASGFSRYRHIILLMGAEIHSNVWAKDYKIAAWLCRRNRVQPERQTAHLGRSLRHPPILLGAAPTHILKNLATPAEAPADGHVR